MSERTKILNFLLENGCEIIHFESYNSLRVHFKKGKAPMQIVLDNVDFIEFKKAFDTHHKEMVTYVTYLLGSNVYSEDICADCFKELWENGVPYGYSVKSFLFERTKTKVASLGQSGSRVINGSYIKRKSTNNGNKTYLPASHLPPGYSRDVNRNLESEEWADGMLIKAELVGQIAKQLEVMPVARREIFDYVFIKNMEYHEIASLTGLSIDTIRVQKHKIVKGFKKIIGLDIDPKSYWYTSASGYMYLAAEFNKRKKMSKLSKTQTHPHQDIVT